MALTRGWQTDLAVLRHLGSLVDHRFDHIIVSSPENTTFHWGNFVLVTDADAADDAARWVQVFRTEFPNAEHVSIGLPRLPAEGSWNGTGLVIDTDEVLFTETRPEQRLLADGYSAPVRDRRRLGGSGRARRRRQRPHRRAGARRLREVLARPEPGPSTNGGGRRRPLVRRVRRARHARGIPRHRAV
ncbi:hypothetical protein BA895_12495 [Humibacillus sp. DSM 29435]|uniref:hypothetical protein n=1 Tax=Humibacillus sp. DSM 29435 TaxID=1869167 RepID=UPI000872A40B|nr:hypothetical protein [Humibacillus sp. DSM 29435]OFE18430.1 hypothetical protein BA895_12495 [Humibacillus sp. DSM 29435]